MRNGSKVAAALAALTTASGLVVAGLAVTALAADRHDSRSSNAAVAVGTDTEGRLLLRTAVCWGQQAEVSVMAVRRNGDGMIGSGTDGVTVLHPARALRDDRTIVIAEPGPDWSSSPSIDGDLLAAYGDRTLIIGTDVTRPGVSDDPSTDHTLTTAAEWRSVPPGRWLTTAGDGDEPRPDGYLTSEQFHAYACDYLG